MIRSFDYDSWRSTKTIFLLFACIHFPSFAYFGVSFSDLLSCVFNFIPDRSALHARFRSFARPPCSTEFRLLVFTEKCSGLRLFECLHTPLESSSRVFSSPPFLQASNSTVCETRFCWSADSAVPSPNCSDQTFQLRQHQSRAKERFQ